MNLYPGSSRSDRVARHKESPISQFFLKKNKAVVRKITRIAAGFSWSANYN
jgi:hypothetical protein